MDISNDEFYSKLVIHNSCDMDTSQNISEEDEEIDRYLSRKILKELDNGLNENLQNMNNNGPKTTKKLGNFIKKMYEDKNDTQSVNEENQKQNNKINAKIQLEKTNSIKVETEKPNIAEQENKQVIDEKVKVVEKVDKDEMKRKIMKNKNFFKHLSLKFYKSSQNSKQYSRTPKFS